MNCRSGYNLNSTHHRIRQQYLVPRCPGRRTWARPTKVPQTWYRYIMYFVSNHCQYIPLNMRKVFLFCFVAIFSLHVRVFMWLIQPYFLDCCAWMTQWHGPERYGWNRLVPNYYKTKPSTKQYLILGMHCYWCAYWLWYWITWWKLSDIVFVRLPVNNQLQTILI